MSARRTLRRVVAATSVLGVLATAASFEEDVRTDPGAIAGFDVRAEAAPIAVRLFENTFPIPSDPGKPHVQMTPGYSSTSLGAGPVARATASFLWPGDGVGEGFGLIVENFGGDPEDEYPLRKAASFPSGPLVSEEEHPTGSRMYAQALGLDVLARTELTDELLPGLVSSGTARSVASSVVEDGLATATADSRLTDVSLLEGLITIDTVRTRLVATSDGVEATVDGATDVAGLTVAGTRFAIDRDGARADGDDEDSPFAQSPSLPLRLAGVVDLSDLIGVTVEVGGVEDITDDEVAVAGRRSEGVTITLELGVLMDLLNSLPLDVVLDALPDELRAQVLPLLGLSPTVEIAVGFADVEVSASQALSFPDLPPPPPIDAPPPATAPMDLPPVDGPALGATPPVADVMGPVATEAAPPVAAAPTLPARTIPGPVGLATQLAVLCGLLAVAGTTGLQRLTNAAFAAPGAAKCTHGTGAGVPDLRAGS